MPPLVSVVGAKELHDQIGVQGGLITGRVTGVDAARQHLDGAVRIRAVEVGERVAIHPALDDDAVRRRPKPVVRHTAHDVAKIDQERARDKRRVTLAARELDGEPGYLGAGEYSQEAVVGVWALTEGVRCR